MADGAPRRGHIIGGEKIAGTSWRETRNPADLSDVVGVYAEGGNAEVDAACAAAKNAFAEWSTATPQRRFEVLDKMGTEIIARAEELGRLLTREQGKTLNDAKGEVLRAGNIFKFFAGEAIRLSGEHIDSVRPGLTVDVSREPVGVVGMITPWNFPIAIPTWKLAPALAYGNCVVMKPASIVPGCVWELADIGLRAGLPAGVFNVVIGPGSVGEAILRHPTVSALSFTGSEGIGRKLRMIAAERGIRIQLEMGGKNPLVVMDDADMETALHCAIDGAFFSTGQRCTASSRLIVTEGIHDRFVEALSERASKLVVGNGLEAGVQIGPAASQAQLETNLKYVQIGKDEGAKLRTGGERLKRGTEGWYFAPTVFSDTSVSMRVNQEEIFGPVATVIRVKNFEEALAAANGIDYGLSAGIVTTSLKYATEYKRRVQAGMVMVNVPTAGVDYHVPFGGRKASSYGPREQGPMARDFYTIVKTSYTKA